MRAPGYPAPGDPRGGYPERAGAPPGYQREGHEGATPTEEYGRPAEYDPARQPVHAPPPAGPSPSYQQVNVSQPAAPPYPGAYPGYPVGWRRRLPNLAAPIASVLMIVSGAIVILGTFFNWIFSQSGWDLMFRGGFPSGRNFLFSWGHGILFSGFWSLLFGVLIILGGVILLTDRVYGSDLVLVSSVIVLAISVVDIVMAYVNTSQAIGPGVGLWLVAVFAFLALIFGAVGVPSEAYYVE